jgi:PTS system N-acetylgalactosamine-specific IIA component
MSSPRALVAGHGDFAAGMLSAVHLISGRDDVFVGLTNRDLGAQDVERVMRDRLAAGPIEVIFTDLPAGSCTMAARRIQRDRPHLTVVTGVNLATLLDFVFQAGEPENAARHAAEKGRAALAVSGERREP